MGSSKVGSGGWRKIGKKEVVVLEMIRKMFCRDKEILSVIQSGVIFSASPIGAGWDWVF